MYITMKISVRVIAIIALILKASVWGQSILSSSYPFGLPLRSLSGTALCMGGTSAGIPNDHHVMLTNPGNLGTINTTAFSSLLLIDYLRIKDNDLYTDHLNAVPRQISFALPFGIAGTAAFSLSKNTDVTLKYRQGKTRITPGDPLYPKYYRISHDSQGGTTNWQAGWGRAFGKYINVGLAYQRSYFLLNSTKLEDYIYSKIVHDTTFLPDTNIIDTITSREEVIREITERDSSHYVFRGNAIRVGLMGTLKDLSIGLAVNYYFKSELSYKNAIYNEVNSEPISSSAATNAKIVMQPPPSIAMGLSYTISQRWLIGADLHLDMWKYYTLEIDTFSAKTQEMIRKNISDIADDNTITVSSGFSFIPAPNLLVPKYWETIHYRGGIRYSQLPGKKSSEISGSLGFGFPLSGNGLLDLGLEIGKRTHDNYSNYEERFLQVIIGINGGRKWRKIPTGTY